MELIVVFSILSIAIQIASIFFWIKDKWYQEGKLYDYLILGVLMLLLIHQGFMILSDFSGFDQGQLNPFFSISVFLISAFLLTFIVFARSKKMQVNEFGFPDNDKDQSGNGIQFYENFKILTEFTRDMIWTMNPEGDFIYVSPTARKLLGYDPYELLMQKLEDQVSQDSYQDVKAQMDNAVEKLEAGERITGMVLEVEHLRKDGTAVWTEITINSHHDAKGVPLGFVGVTRDISDRKSSEKKLLYRYKFGQMVSDISQKIIGTKSVELDSAIEYALAQIGSLEGIDRCYISLVDDELNEISNTHEWCADGIPSRKNENQNIWLNAFPYFAKELQQLRIIQYSDATKMPEEAEKERKIFQSLDIKSVMMIPLVQAKQLLGILGFEAHFKARTWDENLILYSKMVSDIISNALMRKAYIEVLQENEEKYKLLTDITFEGIALHQNGEVIDCNDSFLKIFQLKREDVLGKNPFLEFVDAEHHRVLEQRFSMGNTEPFIIKARRKDEQVIYLECEGKALDIEEEKYQVASLRDVTSRITAENALKESEATLASIFKAAPIGIGMVKERRFIVVNDEICKMLGYKRKELIAQNSRMLYQSDQEYIRVGEVKYESISEHGIGSVETQFVKKNGDIIEIFLSSTPINPDDFSKGVIFTAMDITEQKRAAFQLQESQIRYQKLVDQAVDAIFIYNKDADIIEANQMASKMLGYSRDELLKMNIRDIDLIMFNKYQGKDVLGSLSEEDYISFESQHSRKDGSTFLVDVRLSEVVLEGETFILAFARDITELKKAQHIQDVLYNISTAVGRSDDLSDLFGIIHIELDKLVDTSNFFIALYDKEKDLMHLPYMKDTKKVFESFPAGDTITSLVIKNNVSYFLKDHDISELAKKNLIKRYGAPAKVWVGVPLKIEDEPIGVMVLQNYDDDQAYDQKDLELLETIAPQISLSIIRKKNEEELKWIQMNLTEAQRVANLGSWERDIETGLTYWSDEFFRICGLDPGAVTPSPELASEIIHEEDRKMVEQAIEMTISTGEAYSLETRIVLPDGNVRHVLSKGEIIHNEANEPHKLIGSYLDITQRIVAQQALKDSEEKYRNLAESAPYGIVVHGDYRVMYANNEAGKILDVENADALLGRNVMDIVHPDFVDIVRERIEKIYASDVKLDAVEEKFYTFNKRLIDVEVSVSSITFNGHPAAQVIFRDISRHKKDEDAIRKLSSAVEKSPASVTITDANGIIEYVNPRFCEVTGYSQEEIIGQTHSMLNSGKHDEEFYQNLWNTIKAGEVWQGEVYNKKKSGEFFWAEESISSLKSASGEITHYVALYQDITGRKLMEEELIRAKEKAEGLNKVKSNFLATMSHELRTPLNGILGFAEILSDIIEDKDQKEMADIINQSGKRLLDTLNSILNLSAMESNQLQFRSKETDARQVILDVKKLYIANANKKKIYLVTDFKTPYTVVNTDERFLRQVCNNLLNNAIKYTNNGGVIIEVDEEEYKDKHWLSIKFVDSGIGISEKNLTLVFDEFRQISEGYNREFEGSGLGLHICKRYVDAMGGEIDVTSKLGEGSTFFIRIPFEDSPEHKASKSFKKAPAASVFKDAPDRMNVHILLVEDEESNQQYVQHLLTKLRYTVKVADSGEQAIEFADKDHFDIILMDINLGKEMNGIEAMNEIRKKEGYAEVSIVAVTANAMSGHKEEFLAEGFNNYISKPFSMENLSGLINEILDDDKSS